MNFTWIAGKTYFSYENSWKIIGIKGKKLEFEPQIEWPPMEKARKTDRGNGMVYHVPMKTSRDMSEQKSIKSEKSADSAK